jgi:hypothetical protein
LEQRFARLGLTADDLGEMLRYVRDRAPLVIHFGAEVLQYFLKDTHYRNQFETGMSKGALNYCLRSHWESRVFGGHYDDWLLVPFYPQQRIQILTKKMILKPTQGFDRPKYGVLNLENSRAGVDRCYGYGTWYFVLKEVRLRTTFASDDTSSKSVQLGTCENYAHILELISDEGLQGLVRVAKQTLVDPNYSERFLSSSCYYYSYLEVQIHGPVEIAKNIAKIVAPASEAVIWQQQLQEFSQKYNIPFETY